MTGARTETDGARPPAAAPSVPIDVGSGRPVLLIHGQPGSGTDWWPLAGELRSQFRVIAPDRPGWGSHPRPATTLTGNAEALVRMLSLRGVEDGPVLAVGHSLGGGIALELALSRPDLVGGLVLIASVGVQAAVTGMDRLLAVPLVGDGVLRAGGATLRRAASLAKKISRLSQAEPLVEQATRLAAVRAFLAEGDRPMGGRDRRSFLVEQRALIEETPSIERRISSLRVPCAVIQGTADHIVSPQAARDLAGAIPGAELLSYKAAGHRLPFEQPEVIAAAVRRYSALMG